MIDRRERSCDSRSSSESVQERASISHITGLKSGMALGRHSRSKSNKIIFFKKSNTKEAKKKGSEVHDLTFGGFRPSSIFLRDKVTGMEAISRPGSFLFTKETIRIFTKEINTNLTDYQIALSSLKRSHKSLSNNYLAEKSALKTWKESFIKEIQTLFSVFERDLMIGFYKEKKKISEFAFQLKKNFQNLKVRFIYYQGY